MENQKEVKEQLQKAVDVLCKFKCQDEEFALMAQSLGLQAEKRRYRCGTTKYHNLINFLRCDAFDYAGLSLSLNIPNISMPSYGSPEKFFKENLEYLIRKRETFHKVANNLVILLEKEYAGCLYCLCECLKEDIKYYRRFILEGDKNGWDATWVLIRQTTAEDEHDTLEKKEKSVGYDY